MPLRIVERSELCRSFVEASMGRYENLSVDARYSVLEKGVVHVLNIDPRPFL